RPRLRRRSLPHRPRTLNHPRRTSDEDHLAGGLEDRPASIVATDGTVTDGPNPDFISGITIVDVPSREEALKWAAKVAAACRCTQEVRAIGFDPELDAMLREAASRRRRHDDV